MSEELKQCPFCGAEAKIKAATKSYSFTIWCACKCGARTEGFCPDTNKEDDTMENIEECKKRAIEAWNRRANDETDLCERIEGFFLFRDKWYRRNHSRFNAKTWVKL